MNDVIRFHAEGRFEIRDFLQNSKTLLDNIPKHLVSEKQKNTGIN